MIEAVVKPINKRHFSSEYLVNFIIKIKDVSMADPETKAQTMKRILGPQPKRLPILDKVYLIGSCKVPKAIVNNKANSK